MTDLPVNEPHYGDNLEVLREKIPDEVADLIYLDPPFNSSRSYNLLFKQVKGKSSPAQIHAFEDTLTWSPLLYEQFKAERRNARLFETNDHRPAQRRAGLTSQCGVPEDTFEVPQ